LSTVTQFKRRILSSLSFSFQGCFYNSFSHLKNTFGTCCMHMFQTQSSN